MSTEEFRQHGHTLIDWIADYWERVEDFRALFRTRHPVLSVNDYLLPPPEAGEPFEDLIRDLDDIVMPGITHWQHPSWFAFPSQRFAAVGTRRTSFNGLGVQGMLWSTSPAATEIESHVLDWLVDLLDLPSYWKTTEQGGGVLQMSASDSTHTALVVARHQATNRGVQPGSMVAYASTQTHSSIQKRGPRLPATAMSDLLTSTNNKQ